MSVSIYVGEALDTMRQHWPDQSVQCGVSSPPYWGQRDYFNGAAGLGNEPVHDCVGWATGAPCGVCYVCKLVAVFREFKRVLRDDGLLFLNLGDCYFGGGKGPTGHNGIGNQAKRQGFSVTQLPRDKERGKNLVGIPWRVAFALQADGWILRRDIIWDKPNPMPESVEDRPSTSHEYVFMFSKSNKTLFWEHEDGTISDKKPAPDYIWRNDETGEEATIPPDNDDWHRVNRWSGRDYFYNYAAMQEKATRPGEIGTLGHAKGRAIAASPLKIRRDHEQLGNTVTTGEKRNARSVWTWTIPTYSFKGAHFATMPPDLAERCIRAGSRPGDVVADMFGGAGTTCLEADRHQRHGWAIELNREYAQMAYDRIIGDAGMFADVKLIETNNPQEVIAA